MKCIICSNPKRLEVDRMIVSSGNIALIAKTFDLPYASVYSHSQNHVSRQLAQVMEKRDIEQNFDLLQKIDSIIGRAEDIFLRNYKKGADGLALKALDSQRNTIELLAKISYSLHQAKLAEIELAKIQSGEFGNEGLQAYQESLGVLTNAELRILIQLQNKIETQDKSIIVIPDDASTFPKEKRRTKFVEEVEEVEASEEEKAPEVDLYENYRVRPIQSEIIPDSQKSRIVSLTRR